MYLKNCQQKVRYNRSSAAYNSRFGNRLAEGITISYNSISAMATGSGKTYTAITFIYRLLKFGKAKRILFLVDTKNLGEQAEQEMMAYVPNDDNRIVDNNCWFHDKDICVASLAPRKYYEMYEWNTGTDIMTSDDPYSTLIRAAFKSIPLNWKDLIDESQLPDDFPADLPPMLLQSSTMLDFMEAMLDLSQTLGEQQTKFKRLLQYLHRSSAMNGIYAGIGIKGFDGNRITDWDEFQLSFKSLFAKRTANSDLYNLFINMHSGLEMYGIVKGRPRKQKFMSLINDGKHAYYAAHSHILVTRDVDMINKTHFLYALWNVATRILTPEQFSQFLNDEALLS